MRVVYFAPENSGVGYYRFYQPLEDLKERGLIELKSWGFDFTNKRHELPSTKELKEFGTWGDIFVFGRFDVPEYKKAIETIKEFTGKPVLLDIDDNIFSISPYLPAHQSYDPNGFALKIHEEIVKYVDGIIVSTPALEEIYKKYNKVWVIPNGIKYLHSKLKHDGINIGYLCSTSHLENAQIVEPAIIRVLRKYQNVRFYYTKSFGGFMDFIPEEIKAQVNYLPFFPLKDYLSYVNNLKLDIGIAPLMNNDFNKCKSNIRVLEYWQNQTAVVASPLLEYNRTIRHGFNGYLAQDDEWEEMLDDLVRNPERRNYLIKNASQSLKDYDVSIFADKYYKVLREFIDG